MENYCRKKESPIISELEFLIPHIKSVYGTKFTEEMGLREHEDNSVSNETDDCCEEELDDLIDLTEEIDFKPIIKADNSLDSSLDSSTDGKNTFSPEIFYPSVHINTNGNESKGVENTESQKKTRGSSNVWNNEYCTVAQYKEGEFMNSAVLCADIDNDDNSPSTSTNCEDGKLIDSRKRPRAELEESHELHSKILQLLSNFDRRERLDSRFDQEGCDEDRMFLLSLVSDLKRVPAAKKMVVKAEIATSIAKAIQS